MAADYEWGLSNDIKREAWALLWRYSPAEVGNLWTTMVFKMLLSWPSIKLQLPQTQQRKIS
jgi:hypothetical protein